MSRPVRNTIVAFGQHVLGAASGAVGIFFIARELPRAEHHLGIVGFALSFVGLFVAVQRAFDLAHTKRISEGQPVDRCNGTYLILKILATTVLVAVVLGSLFVWEHVLGQGFQSQLHVTLVQIVVVYHALNAVGEFARKTFDGHGNILYGQLILSAEHVVKGAATVYVAFYGLEPFVPGARNALGLGVAYVLGAAALAVLALLLVSREPFSKPTRDIVKSYWTFSIPILATNLFFTTSDEIAQVLLQLFWNAKQVGIFFAPQRYTKFLPSIANAASTALFPVISSIHGRGETAPEIIEKALRWMSIVLLPMIAVTVALPQAVIHVLLSDRFLAATPVLVILSIGGYVKALRLTLNTKLSGVNKPEEVLKAGVLSSIANALLVTVLVAPSLFGIPLLGLKATGAALGVVASFGVGFVWTLQAARKHADVTFPPIWRHAVMFVASAAALRSLTLLLPQTSFRIYHLLGAGALSALVFFLAGVATRELGEEDWALARRILSPERWRAFFSESGDEED